jgi:hypothetical protein
MESNLYYQKYLKYKNKYISLKNMIGGNEISTIIDDLKFTLIAKHNGDPTNLRDDRDKVIIESSNLDGNNSLYFIVYLSNSEFGCWRFACLEGGQYYKGADYVTHTFIDIRLQKFIFDNYHRIPCIIINEMIQSSIRLNTNDFITKLSFSLKNEYDEYLHTKFLPEFNNYLIDVIFTRTKHLINNDYAIYRKYIQETTSKDYIYFFPITYLIKCGDYRPYYSKIFNNYPEMRDILCSHIPNFPEKYSKYIKGSKVIYDFFSRKEVLSYDVYMDNPHDELKTLYNIYDSYLKQINMTPIKDTLKFSHNYKKTYERAEIFMNIYTIDVTVGDDIFILYCGNYKFIYNGTTNYFNCIINLIPKENKITRIGLHQNILTIGGLLCKIIDYTDQIKIMSGNIPKINNTYSFLGHYMHNIYPLNIIEFPPFVDFEIPNDLNIPYQPLYKYHESPLNLDNDIFDMIPNPEVLSLIEPCKDLLKEFNLCEVYKQNIDIEIKMKKIFKDLYENIPKNKKYDFLCITFYDFFVALNSLPDEYNCKYTREEINNLIVQNKGTISKYIDSLFNYNNFKDRPDIIFKYDYDDYAKLPIENIMDSYVPTNIVNPRDYEPVIFELPPVVAPPGVAPPPPVAPPGIVPPPPVEEAPPRRNQRL